jgi:hypothetical protein
VTSAVWTAPAPSVARTSIVCWPGPAAAASQAYSHWTQVASEIGTESWAVCQAPPSIATSTLATPRSGAHAIPATGTRPAATCWPLDGVSIRDCVRIGPSFDQPSGTQ